MAPLSLVRPARRLQRLPTQFFSRLVATTQSLIAAGHDIINVGQGNPDQPTFDPIVERLCQVSRDPAHHRYGPFDGLRVFKEAVAGWYHRRFGVSLDPQTEVCVLIGSKIGLQEISLCLLEQGDVCLMPDPCYPDYWSGVALAGAESVPMPLLAQNQFLPDFSALPADVLERARLMFLNYPCNPTGRVASAEFFSETVAFAAQHGITVAHDLAYGDIVYDGRKPTSFLQTPGAKDVGVEFGTLSKSYNMAGWRLGWVVGNPEIIAAMNLIQDHLNCSHFGPVQAAGAEALSPHLDGAVADLRDLYQERRDTFVRAARNVGWDAPSSPGTFYVWCPVPQGFTAAGFSELLLQEARVVTAPGIGFGPSGEGYVRVSLTVPASRLAEAAERIGRLNVL